MVTLLFSSCSCTDGEFLPGCEELVSEILRIQDLRSMKMKEINLVLERYDAKALARDEMLKHTRAWRAGEQKMSKDVAELYLEARRMGCL